MINALKVVGNDLFLAGNFTSAGETNANYIARYDGNIFYPLGTGMNERVYRLDAFAGDLIAGGQFSQALPAGRVYSLMRVRLDNALQLVPEISGHRLMVLVRLMRQETDGRLRPSSADTGFELTLCA